MFNNLFKFITRSRHLGAVERNDKYLLIITNIVFLITFYKLYKRNKVTKRTHLLLLIFLISFIYHTIQCHHSNHKLIDYCLYVDLLNNLVIGIIALYSYHNKINLKIVLLTFLSFFIFTRPNSLTQYIYCHSLWHVLMGINMYLLLK